MSTLMDSVAGKGRNISTNFWIWLLIGVAAGLRRQHPVRDDQGLAPRWCQYRGLAPAAELAATGQPGP